MQAEVQQSHLGDKPEGVIPRSFRVAFILVTSLFFMWAIAHNMNDILIRQFQKALDLSRSQASFVQISFYLAYFVAAIPAGYAMKSFGFKKTIIIGLFLYALGACLFYPASEIRDYNFFLVALFIIACGIVFLETSGSGYITLVGDPRNSAQRINFSQSFNGLGGVTAPIIGGLFIFSGMEYSPEQLSAMSPGALAEYRILEAQQVQIPYLIIAAVVAVVAVLIYITPFQQSHAEGGKGARGSMRGLFYHRSFTCAVIAQFFYVGAQIGVWSYFIDFTKEMSPVTPEKTAAFYLSLSLFSFMVGRFAGTFIMHYVKPRTMLGLYALVNVFLVLAAVLTSGLTAVVAIGLTSFFMSIMFPTIYALGLVDLGDQSEVGSSLIIMTIISGAMIPPSMGYLSDAVSVQWAYLVPMGCYLVVFITTIVGGSARD